MFAQKGAGMVFKTLGVALVFVFTIGFIVPSIVDATNASTIVASLSKEKSESAHAIENPAALSSFFAYLSRTASKQSGAITRIGHYGDSLVEMDLLSGQMRRRIQTKFGDSGHGFVLITPSQPWYRPYDLGYKPDLNWLGFDLTMKNLKDRRLGLGHSLAFSNSGKARTQISTARKSPIGQKVSRFELMFPIEPSGGPVEISVDGKKKGTVNTQGSSFDEGYIRFDVPDGAHRFYVTAKKERLRLYGAIIERTQPGVVYDSLGLNSMGVSTFNKLDTAHWSRQLQHRNYQLVILGFGTNEAVPSLNLDTYKRNIVRIVGKIKAALPNASVLLMAPMDKAKKKGTALVSHPMIPKIVQAQREAAKESGAAFWSTFDAMGGSGSMAKWYQKKPRLGAGDLMHPTPKGGEVLGNYFYTALMQAFANYLSNNPVPSGPAPQGKSPLTQLQLN